MLMKNLLKQNQSLFYALVILLLLIGWLASGYLSSEQRSSPKPAAEVPRSLVQKVRVRVPEIKRISQEVVLNGRTEPARAVTLRAEVEGRVIAIGAEQGSVVTRGDLIVQLDSRDRKARLEEARALLKQREAEHSGSLKLQKDNLQSETQVALAAALLASARAQVAAIELEIRNTRVLAPFDGIVDRLPVEVGAYLQGGEEIARLIERDPIIFVGYVSQLERHDLILGDKGIVHLVTGQAVEGELRYVAAEADPVTRTFKVEVQIPNPDASLVSGITAELRIPVRFVSAFQLSPALLSLNESDQLGIKVVNSEDQVEFLPVQVVKSTADGIWITGVSEGMRVITVGQGFVRAGEQVIAVDEAVILNQSSGG